MNSASLSRIGVVAIGRNEGERLKRCIRSLPHGLAAIVYVDSGFRAATPGCRRNGAHPTGPSRPQSPWARLPIRDGATTTAA
jgi:hypothetical protein